MTDIKLDKKLIAIAAGILFLGVIVFFLFAPLFGKVHGIGTEVKVLESEMKSVRDVIDAGRKAQWNGHLLTRQEVSRAINEITRIGAALNINFLSTSPQKVMKPEDSPYPVLPIEMDLQSQYKDLGLFLGSLERLKESIVTVKSFHIETDRKILPQVKTELVVEVYLRGGEDG